MPPALPRTIALKLEQTLAQWRQWHCDKALPGKPETVEILTGGISNYSVRVRADADFVVRIDGINPTQIGLSRQSEYRALQDAHRAGLAPCPRYFNPDLDSLVCDFLPPQQAAAAMDWQAVGALMAGIHALPPRHHRLDHGERALRYEKIIEHRGCELDAGLLACQRQIHTMMQELQPSSDDWVLCHNDLLHSNRLLSDGRLWAIDWEYCAMGSRWYDLAVTIEGDELEDEQATALLAHYLQRDCTEQEWLAVRRYGCIYRYLELLWYLARDEHSQGSALVDQKSAALNQRLALDAP